VKAAYKLEKGALNSLKVSELETDLTTRHLDTTVAMARVPANELSGGWLAQIDA